MHPVKDKIYAEQQQNERPPMHLKRPDAIVFPQITIDDIDSSSDQHIDGLVAESRAKICDGLRKRNVITPVDVTKSDLDQHEKDRDRRQICIDICVLHSR